MKIGTPVTSYSCPLICATSHSRGMEFAQIVNLGLPFCYGSNDSIFPLSCFVDMITHD